MNVEYDPHLHQMVARQNMIAHGENLSKLHESAQKENPVNEKKVKFFWDMCENIENLIQSFEVFDNLTTGLGIKLVEAQTDRDKWKVRAEEAENSLKALNETLEPN